jgi:hypothetical protein
MQYILYTQLLAQAYGTDSYSSMSYGDGKTTTSTGTSTSSGSNGGGVLANTGVAIAGFVTLACLVLLAAIIVRVWRRPAKSAEETVENR